MEKKIAEDTLPGLWTVDLVRDYGFAPLRLEWKPVTKKASAWDALLHVSGDDFVAVSFAVFYRKDMTPKLIAQAAAAITGVAQRANLLPLLLVPYLSDERLLELEQRSVSALDLCGNGVLKAPGKFLVFRTGHPNRFTSSRPLKNVYRGVSSLVARTFLLTPEYAEIGDLQQEITCRGGDVSLPTISKTLKELEDDLIIRRTRRAQKPQARSLQLLQPEKLLAHLTENYTPPKVMRSFTGKVALDADELRQALHANAQRNDARMIATGIGSASRYATLAMENTLTLYTDSLDALLSDLPATPTQRFPNLILRQTEEPTVYFDPRPDQDGFPWASPICAYLEMSHGEPRLVQTASQVRDRLLAAIKEERPKL